MMKLEAVLWKLCRCLLSTGAGLFFANLACASACSWDNPGQHPYMGDVPGALDHYRDIPPAVRSTLRQRMLHHEYDDVATITRDDISGKYAYGDLRKMHFGQDQMCDTITRAKWPALHRERGLVYCESTYCVIVPTVCRNVSLVTRLAPAMAEAGGGGPPVGDDELIFPPPGAGLPSESGPAGGTGGAGAGPLGLTGSGPAVPNAPATGLWNGGTTQWITPVGVMFPAVTDVGSLTGRVVPVGVPSVPSLPSLPTAPVPEPSQWLGMALGLAMLAALKRFRSAA